MIKSVTGDDHWPKLAQALIERPQFQDALQVQESTRWRTEEEWALVVIEAELTYDQFDTMAKRAALGDPRVKSWWPLLAGMRAVEAQLPPIRWLIEGKPGVCVDPPDLFEAVLTQFFDRLEFKGSQQDKLFVVRAGDGCNEGKGEFPMYQEAFNLPQDPDCQSPLHCFVTALGRIIESVDDEKKHLSTFCKRWVMVKAFRDKVVVQVYVGDGSDLSKKVGMGGQGATCFCFRCMAKMKDRQRRAKTGSAQVRADFQHLREYERPQCKLAGHCVCEHKTCAVSLVRKVRAHAIATWPKDCEDTHEGKKDPDAMNNDRHEAIGTWAQKNAHGQLRTPMPLAQHLEWSKQLYYDVFHCNKNCFCNTLWSVTVDLAKRLKKGVPDALSRCLARHHRLGNLQVNQSEDTIVDLKGMGHVRQSHSDLLGDDVAVLLSTKYKLTTRVQGCDISETFRCLEPFVDAATALAETSTKRDAKKIVPVLHRLWTKFAEGQRLRFNMRR